MSKKTQKKTANISWMVFARFIRTLLPQLVVAIPFVTDYVVNNRESLPLWAVPTIAFCGTVITALDKLYRELQK